MANTFPTTLNDWDDGDTIESGWADAIEAKIGIDNSAVATSLDYLIKNTSSKLGAIASLAVTDGNIIVGNGTNWVAESGATARTSLGLGTTDSPAFAALTVGTAGVGIRDTSAAYDVTIVATSSSALTTGRTLTLDLVNAARTLKIAGTSSINQDVQTTASPTFGGLLLTTADSTTLEIRAGNDVNRYCKITANLANVQFISNSAVEFMQYNSNAVSVYLMSGGGNVTIGGTAARASTAGTNTFHIFNGTAPVGTLANGISIYSSTGECYIMDAAGNATLQSPHDKKGYWVFDSKNTVTGKHIRIDMEKMMKFLNGYFGLDFVHEFSV